MRLLPFKLIKKRTIPVPTLPGCALGLLVLVGLVVVFALNIVSFLCEESEVDCEILVVEGWTADYQADRVAEDFKKDGYKWLYTTGGPPGKAFYLSDYKTYATITAATLVKLGVDKDQVIAASAADTHRNRTFEAARALRDKLAADGLKPKALMVYTDSVHARRSKLVFEKVFGEGVVIGTVAMENQEIDRDAWWRTSSGVKNVIMESIAWVYEWVADSGRDE